MTEDTTSVMRSVRSLMDEYRTRCLWYLREDYYPETPEAAITVLESIERHGDVEAFRKAATLRQRLSRHSSSRSAD
jgi:hypothetical protein